MAHPFASQPFQLQLAVQLLLAPSRQLSGDGQLRELMQERRRHLGDGSGGLWYLSPERLAEHQHYGLQLSADGTEALAIREPHAAQWLQLRFGGQLQPISLSSAWLMGEVLELPAPAPLAPVGCASLRSWPPRPRPESGGPQVARNQSFPVPAGRAH